MTLIALGSVAGSPGVTRLAIGLAAAWPGPRRRVLVEADEAGGRLGAELGVGTEPGLMTLALHVRTASLTADELVDGGAGRSGDWFVVPAPPSGEQAHSALAHSAAPLAAVMAGAPDDVWLIDVGRLTARSPALPFATAADRLVLVARGTFADLQLVAHRVEALRQLDASPAVVVVQPTPWSADEVASFVGADVVGVLPAVSVRDRGLGAMRGVAWRSWWRAIVRVAATLDDAADLPAGAPSPPPAPSWEPFGPQPGVPSWP